MHRLSRRTFGCCLGTAPFGYSRLGNFRRMHMVITGATGNVGTSVIESLASDADVTSMLGLARRLPNWQAPKTQWAQADVAKDELVSHLRGADVLIHLAWLFQPTHNPVTTWTANVEGSIRTQGWSGCGRDSSSSARRPRSMAPAPSARVTAPARRGAAAAHHGRDPRPHKARLVTSTQRARRDPGVPRRAARGCRHGHTATRPEH